MRSSINTYAYCQYPKHRASHNTIPSTSTITHHLHHHHLTTVFSPLCPHSFFRFPKDRTTLSVDDQFLWGSGFMVSPVLQKGRVKRDVYFPQDNWFDYYTVRLAYILSYIQVENYSRHPIKPHII